jgi:hypothetical protein
LERRIRAWCQEQQEEEDEGKSSSGGLTLPVSAPQVFPGRPPDHLLAVERMVNLAAEVAALSPDLQKDPIMRAARGTLKAVLTSLRPQAPMQANPPRLQADPGKPDAPE